MKELTREKTIKSFELCGSEACEICPLYEYENCIELRNINALHYLKEKEPAPAATGTSSIKEKNPYTCYDTTDIERCQEYLKQIRIMLDSVVLTDMGNATDLRNIGIMQVLVRLAIDELNKGN